jgi:succinate-acetate transporter protein
VATGDPVATGGPLIDRPGGERPVPAPLVPMPDPHVPDPAPLGLAGFAFTTFLLSISNTHVWPTAVFGALSGAIFYGGIAQLLAGMWEFRRANTFGALAFSSYGAFWLATWYFAVTLHGTSDPYAFGSYLLGWTIFTFYMMIASTRVSGVVFGIFLFLDATFVVLTIAAFTSSGPTGTATEIGGWLGVATAAIAWYASAAGVINATFRTTVLPTFPALARTARL